MQITITSRGFEVLEHPVYPPEPALDRPDPMGPLVAQSSAISDYPDAFDRPGSSYLWLGERHHLNREEVAQLVWHLKVWLETGHLQR